MFFVRNQFLRFSVAVVTMNNYSFYIKNGMLQYAQVEVYVIIALRFIIYVPCTCNFALDRAYCSSEKLKLIESKCGMWDRRCE